MNMKSVRRTLANNTLYRRIDEMPMNVTDREFAKAQLRASDIFVDDIASLGTAMRSMAARVSRHVRIALTASPQH
jgi:hypothetical protein